MESFIELSEEEQRRYINQTANGMALPPASVEKDFWVCWVLRELFRLPGWDGSLTFKGGTSLSKGWGLIQRFSEDIDIVVDKDYLGFGGERSPESAPSRKATKKCMKELKAASIIAVNEDLRPKLEDAARTLLPPELPWELLPDEADPDDQTLLFRYGTLFGSAYLKPQVKIELGARSDTEPVETIEIEPYVVQQFPEFRGEGNQSLISAIRPERTFWEKALLLHEERYRPPEKHRKSRLARHYYDLACLIEAGVSKRAVETKGLFERAALHRQIYFEQTWMDYQTMKRGKLQICPGDGDMASWKKDYKDMEEMFFRSPPPFEEIMTTVRKFEEGFNRSEA